eukprot:7381186-Prymnesium_polylepis.1
MESSRQKVPERHERVLQAPVLVYPCEGALDSQPLKYRSASLRDSVGEAEPGGVASVLSRVEASVGEDLDAPQTHEHLRQGRREEGDIWPVRREGVCSEDDAVVIDDGGELEGLSAAVGRVPAEARVAAVLILGERGVDFVAPRRVVLGVGLKAGGVGFLEQPGVGPLVRVFEDGD